MTAQATYDDGFLYVLWVATDVEYFTCESGGNGFNILDAEPHMITVMGEDMDYDELPNYMRDAVDNTYQDLEWSVD